MPKRSDNSKTRNKEGGQWPPSLLVVGSTSFAQQKMSDLKANIINSLDRTHRRVNNKIKDRWPLVSLYFYTRPRAKWLYYRNERALMNGQRISSSKHQSVVFFSVHKAATMYIDQILKDLSVAQGSIPIDYSAWFSSSSRTMYKHYADPDFMNTVFHSLGYYYGAFREFRNIPHLERYKTLLVLRDPRDVLVSHYYSLAYSHAVINWYVYRARKKALKMTIDEWVLQRAKVLVKDYEKYVDNVLDEPNVLYLTYEEMSTDLGLWLNKVVQHIGMVGQQEIIDKILLRSEHIKGSGDKKDHVRSAKAGDHKDKLQPETIAALNKIFGQVMPKLGYPI